MSYYLPRKKIIGIPHIIHPHYKLIENVVVEEACYDRAAFLKEHEKEYSLVGCKKVFSQCSDEKTCREILRKEKLLVSTTSKKVRDDLCIDENPFNVIFERIRQFPVFCCTLFGFTRQGTLFGMPGDNGKTLLLCEILPDLPEGCLVLH